MHSLVKFLFSSDNKTKLLKIQLQLNFGKSLLEQCSYQNVSCISINIIHVFVLHFYDLSTLVGCWSLVYIRRIIYKFLNVCPFDCTAVAVSGKVGYP